MNKTCLAVLAMTALPGFGALADPINPADYADGDMMREITRGTWDGANYVATAGSDGETLHLVIEVDGIPAVGNPAISFYTPVEGASYALKSEADGTLMLDVRQPDSYGGLTHQTFWMRADHGGPVQVTGYDLTIGKEGEVPDFHCKLDLVAGTALIESMGNQIPSPFSGVPADRTTAAVWTDSTPVDISGCINPG